MLVNKSGAQPAPLATTITRTRKLKPRRRRAAPTADLIDSKSRENFASSRSVCSPPTLRKPPFSNGRKFYDPQSVGEIEVASDLRLQQRDRVGGHGIGKAGAEFLGDGGGADGRPLIEHHDLQPRHRQAGGAYQAVVPPPMMTASRIIHPSQRQRAAGSNSYFTCLVVEGRLFFGKTQHARDHQNKETPREGRRPRDVPCPGAISHSLPRPIGASSATWAIPRQSRAPKVTQTPTNWSPSQSERDARHRICAQHRLLFEALLVRGSDGFDLRI